jgi:hypothetical protein
MHRAADDADIVECDNMREFAASPTPAEGEQKSVTEWVSEASLMGKPPTVSRILTVYWCGSPPRTSHCLMRNYLELGPMRINSRAIVDCSLQSSQTPRRN